jgi:hypothetical protein
MTPEEFVELLKSYNFKENSIRKFAKTYKVFDKTVKKYLLTNGIPYNSRTIEQSLNRDAVTGRFTISNKPQPQNS